MSSQNTPLVTHSCLVYTAAGVSIEIHISLTLFTQVKCVESPGLGRGAAKYIKFAALQSCARRKAHLVLSFACGTRDKLNIFRRPSAKLGRRHDDVCLTLLAQLITLLGVHYLLEGELALHWLALCLWLCLIEIENHDGAVGEFCWELEALWGCSFDELAAGAAVAYC